MAPTEQPSNAPSLMVRTKRRKLKESISLVLNLWYDYKRLWRWTSAIDFRERKREKLKALITVNYHCLEKGLSLKNPRVGFGLPKVQNLVGLLENYTQEFGCDDLVSVALNVLQAYYDFNLKHGRDDASLLSSLDRLRAVKSEDMGTSTRGGVKEVTREALYRQCKMDLSDFFASRSSVRSFSPENVELSQVEQAIRMAQKTPSVCNRQSSKVWVLCEQKDILAALDIQACARGFEEQVSKLLVVTSRLTHFKEVGERNQCWIDGGMFSMSLVYALHSLGLGTCCLNWGKKYQVDVTLKELLGMDQSESVIMMIAVGHVPESYRVAQSTTRPLEEVMKIYAS